MLAGTAAGGDVPLFAGSVAVAVASTNVTIRLMHLQTGGVARNLAWLLPVGANGEAAHALTQMELWTPATVDAAGAVLSADVRRASCSCAHNSSRSR